VEPHSHTILNGVGRGFVSLVLDTSNGLVVDGQPFCLSLSLQRKIDEHIIDKLRPNSSYNRPFCYLLRCVCPRSAAQMRMSLEYLIPVMLPTICLHLHCHAVACISHCTEVVGTHDSLQVNALASTGL
jgi:hypothetical protein